MTAERRSAVHMQPAEATQTARSTARDVAWDELLRERAARPEGVWVTCSGPSMEPTVHVGDRVRIRACRHIWPGEVILFQTRAKDRYILHRVLASAPGLPWVLHAGDADSVRGAGLVRTSEIIGRADLPWRLPSRRAIAAGLRRLARAAASVGRGRTCALL